MATENYSSRSVLCMCVKIYLLGTISTLCIVKPKEIFILKICFSYNTYFCCMSHNPEHTFDIVTMPYTSLRTLSYTKADLYKIEKYIRKGIVIDNEKLSGFLPKRVVGIEPTSQGWKPSIITFIRYPHI